MSHAAAFEITQLLYRYAEAIDLGQLEQAAAMFDGARIYTGAPEPLDAAGLLALWRRLIIIYPCGTPRTRHLISNPIVEVAANGQTASARSCYTVLQVLQEGAAPQVIISGRYLDQFECQSGVWRFTARDYRQVDFAGDLSAHLQRPVRV